MNYYRLSYSLTLISLLALCLTLIVKLGSHSLAVDQAIPFINNEILIAGIAFILSLIILPSLFRKRVHSIQHILTFTLLLLLVTAIAYWIIIIRSNVEYKILSIYAAPISINLSNELSYISLFLLLLPLVFILKGILNQKIYTMQWSIYLTLFYFMHGLTDAFSLPAIRMISTIETILSLVLFTFLITTTRTANTAKSDDDS